MTTNKPRITRDHVKKVARFVVARSVSTTVSILIHQNTDVDSKLKSAQIHVAAYALGEMAGDATKDYTDAKVDSIAESAAKIKTAVAKAHAEAEKKNQL